MAFLKLKWTNFKEWFIKLGFWKKLILIFTINTLIILIVMNVLMGVLFTKVKLNMTSISNDQTKQYLSISNSLVANSLVNSFLVRLQVLSDFILRIDSSVHFFQNRSNIYKSLQSGVPVYNPPLSSQVGSVPDFRKPVIYFYNNDSTFHDEPYVDVLLSSLFSANEEKQIKRTNVIYQSVINSSDIFVRTTPGTDDFIIPSIDAINVRFQSLTRDWITITGLYSDSLSRSNNEQKLIALRTVEYRGDFRVLVQVEIYQQTVADYFSKMFYFPSASVILLKILSENPSQYQIINRDSFQLDLSKCFRHSVHQYHLGNGTLLNAYSIAISQTFQIGQSPFIISQQSFALSNNIVGSFRLILLVDKQQLSVPNNFMNSFLSKQSSTITFIIYGWSLVILLATIGLSIVTGNYIFYNLKTLSQKLHQYTRNPSKMHETILELKELQCSGIIKKLIDNVATLIQKIQERKKNKNQSIGPMIYPVNLAEKQFCRKMNLADQQKWKEWKNFLQENRSKLMKSP